MADVSPETTQENVTTQTEEIVTETHNVLDMSDEDISNMADVELETLLNSSEKGNTDGVKDEQSSAVTEEAIDSESATQDVSEEAADSDGTSTDTADIDTADGQSEEETAADSSAESNPLNAEEQLKKVLSPFRANGKDIQVDSVDDAITLMKMGANYNKKMAVMKPQLKFIKMLENEGLLDEGKLANLIDLSKKNPAAIKQLVIDSGIDPLTMDVKEATGYKPDTYTVGDTEVELDLVLDDLKSSPKFTETMSVINTKFDAASKKVLVDSPAIIRVLNEHIELGIYDKIYAVVEKERMLGRLTGLNDIQAYKQVSDAINAQGGLRQESKSTSEKTNESVTTTNANKTVEDTKARKKSAAVTTSTLGKKAESDFNPLAMSDDEIANMPLSKYM